MDRRPPQLRIISCGNGTVVSNENQKREDLLYILCDHCEYLIPGNYYFCCGSDSSIGNFQSIRIIFQNKMNFQILLLILFLLLIFYFLFVKNKYLSCLQQESKQDIQNIQKEEIKESKIKYSIQRSWTNPLSPIERPQNTGSRNEYKNHKWSGVQRNPVCCRINHTNRNFYDSEMYP